MRANTLVLASLSLILALPASFAQAQSASVNGGKGDPSWGGGHNEEAYALKLLAPVNERIPPRTLRKHESCERKFKTVNVDGIIYVAILDCNDKQM